MKLIYEIFHKLKNQEIRQLKHKIQHASFEYEKVGKLFELVTQYEEKEESFYSQALYNKDPDNTFRVTKSRLKRMFENVILQDRSLTGYSSASINARLQAKKKLLQGEILLGRGAFKASKNILFQVISTARKYDLYQEAFQAELLLYRHHSVLTSLKDYQKRTDELLKANRMQYLIDEALIIQYYIANLMRNKTLKEDELAEVREKIDQMATIAEETQHPLVLSGYYLTENFFLQTVGKFAEAREFGEKYLDQLQAGDGASSPQRIANAYAQLAKVSLQLQDVDKARAYCEEVLQRVKPDNTNYLIGLELQFRIEFYDQKYDKAEAIAEEALQHPRIEASKQINAHWHYYQSCVKFKKKDFKSAYQELDYTTPLLMDKYGMNPSLRLLEIMILFELGHYDIMETKILNLRQYIKRTQKKSLFRPQKLIQILIQWYKRSYDFEAAAKANEGRLAELAAYHEEHPFDTSELELIRLEEWMAQKQKA